MQEHQCLECAASLTETTSWPIILSAIAALTALVSTIVGPLAAYKIAKKQLSIGTTLTERKEWIQSLSKNLAAFSAKALAMSYGMLIPETLVPANKLKMLEDEYAIYHKIVLRLDPADVDHGALQDSLKAVIAMIGGTKKEHLENDLLDLRALLAKVTAQGRKVINNEVKIIRTG